MEIGTIQYDVVANTTDLDRAGVAVDKMATGMNKAGAATEVLEKKMNSTARAANESARALDKNANAMKSSGNTAKQLGFQLQDAVVQLQGGAKASVVFAQQGSQLLSVFHPLLGLAAALAGVFGGALYNALTGTSAASADLAESIKKLHKEYQNLDVFQQQYLVNLETDKQKAAREEIAKTQVQIQNLTEQYNKLSLVQGKKSYMNTIATGGVFTTQATGADVAAKERELTAARAGLSYQNDLLAASEKEIQRIRGIEIEDAAKLSKQANDLIKSLRDQTESYGLTGLALAEYTANKFKAKDATREEIVSLVLLSEQQRQHTKDMQAAEQAAKQNAMESARNAKKLVEDENRRRESIEKLAETMQREADLFGVTSKYMQTEYDIKNNLIKVTGGLAGAEAQLLLVKAGRLDQMLEEKMLAESLDEEIDRNLKRTKEAQSQLNKFSEDAAERINGAFASAWVGILDGSKNAFDGIKNAFKQTLAEMAHNALTKPIIMRIQQSMVGGATSAAQGAAGAAGGSGGAGMGMMAGLGPYAIAAVAVVAAVGIWNKKQDEKFVKMTAEYKQANQGLSAILGSGNKKSDTIGTGIEKLKSVNDNVLDVNYEMLSTLQDIRTGIGQTAAGFAKTLVGGADYASMGLKEGTENLWAKNTGGEKSSLVLQSDKLMAKSKIGFISDLGTMLEGFNSSIYDAVGKMLYKKKTKIIDSGINIMGASLASLLEGATLQAFAYADLKTTKKVIGITTSTKVKRSTEDLNEVFEEQLSGVFQNAGKSLKEASSVFGINFDDFTSQLQIKAQDLSLKGLEGDALTKEIESFFGSVMDDWAGVLLSGTDVLLDFQQIGESAFDTMLRLASQTNTFNDYASRLSLNMKAVGMASVYATEQLAQMNGGFDQLSASLAGYYDKFFDENEKFADSQASLTSYFNDIGAAVPRTRAQFRSMIEVLDLTTEAGQKQFTSLIKVSGAVDQYITQLDSTTEAIKKQRDEAAEAAKRQRAELMDKSFSSLGRAVDAQKKIIDGQIAAMNEALTTSRSVYSVLSSTLGGMIIDSKRTQEASRKQAQSTLGAMLGAAKSGRMPNIDDLNSALSVVSQPSENLYSTFQEYAADFYKTADTIKQLQGIAGTQVSAEEKALAQLEKQSTSLDDLLVWGKAQVDKLNGIDIKVLSVATALNNFVAATGVKLPGGDTAKMLAMAAASNATATTTPQQQADAKAAQKQTDQAAKQQRDFYDLMKSSQQALVFNTLKTKELLEKFDVIGMPPERVV